MAVAVEHALDTDPPVAMQIAVAHAIYWVARGRMAEAESTYPAVLAAAPEPCELRARALWGHAWNLLHGEPGERAIAVAEEAIDLAEQVGDLSTAARAFDVIGGMQILTDPANAVATLERGAELARQAGDDWGLGVNLLDTALALLVQGRETESMAAFESAYPVNARIEHGENLCYHWWGTGYFGWSTGDRARLRAGAERCREMAAELGEPNTWGVGAALLAFDDAEHGLAERALQEGGEATAQLVSAGAGLALPWVIGAVAYSQAALGMLDGADETLGNLAGQIRGLVGFEQFTYPAWADVSRLSGDLDQAEAHASKALELALFGRSDITHATAKLAQGRIAAARSEYADAEAKIHEAIALAQPRGFRPLLAEALAGLAVVAAGLASSEEALRLLGSSDRALEDLDGRTRWKHEQAQLDELREQMESEHGPEPYAEGRELSLENAVGWARRARGQRKRPERGWESLTPTELRVVQLVAQGLTNPQIGERMFIARGTVKVHLSHIFAKLGTATRAELAAEATRRDALASQQADPG
jgi:DNA-binding CsgD family transcriptional regulator/tetratricopeptide (TPR) repeat protein